MAYILIRSDSAGATKGFLAHIRSLREQGVRSFFSMGVAITEPIRTAIVACVDWQPAIEGDGSLRDGAEIAEITHLLDMSGYPDGTRLIVRRERPHPGAQLSLFDTIEGLRHQAFVTDTPRGRWSVQLLELRHRAHARVEDRIRTGKDSGFGRFPSRLFAINAAWLELALVGTGAISATRYYSWAGQDCAMRTTGGPLTWLVTDTQGTQQIAIVAGNQAISQRRQTPFGGPRGTAPAWGNERGFVGGDNDPTGLVHIGAREYDAALGRFISVDPVFNAGAPQSWNGYSYANFSPITQSDPTGLDSCFVCNIPGFAPVWKAATYVGGKTAGYVANGVDKVAGKVDDGLSYMSENQGGVWTDIYNKEQQVTTAVMGSPSDPSPVRLGWEWLSGTGPPKRELSDDATMTKQLQQHSHIQSAREMIAEQINLGNPKYTPEYKGDPETGKPKTLSYSLNTHNLLDDIKHNETAFFLGSYDVSWKVDSIDKAHGTATVTFTVENESDMNSGTHTAPFLGGYSQQWDDSVGNWVNSKFRTGPGSPKKQTITWTETIDLKNPKPPTMPPGGTNGFAGLMRRLERFL